MPFNRHSNGGLLRAISMNFGADGGEVGPGTKGKKRERVAPADLGPSLLLATMRTDSSTITRSVASDDLTADDVIILLMGPPGSGKSTFLEIAGGMIEGQMSEAGTTVISAFRVSAAKFSDSNIVLVDTPAFNDAGIPDVETLNMLSAWLNGMYMNGIQLSGLIYFHRISDAKMEGTALRNWRAVEKICGDDFNKVVLTTTMWDNVDSEVGNNRERALQDFWKAKTVRGWSIKRFVCDRPSAADVLLPILENTTKRPLRLQKEITDLNMTLKQTAAARALFLQLEALLHECEQNLVTVRDDLRSPSLNKQELWSLEEKYKATSFQLERANAGLNGLKPALPERLQGFLLMAGLRPALRMLLSSKKPISEMDASGDGEASEPQGSHSQTPSRQEGGVNATDSGGQKQRTGDKKLRKRPK